MVTHLQASDGANGRCGNSSLMAGSSLGNFVMRRVPKYPAHPSKNAHLVFEHRAIFVRGEWFAFRLSTSQPNRALQVVVETPLVVVSLKSFRFSKFLFEVSTSSCVNHSS